jgi:hypothetical protein
MLERSVHSSFHEMIAIMDECATGPWHTRLRGELEEVRFTRGQPLGLGPSFFTFALAHNQLLEGLCRKHRLPRKYFILGDDVVIGNRDLHRIYRQCLQNYGCKVSESKTFKSKELAEFAGFTITKRFIARSFKWREVSDYSFYECLKHFGKDGLALCTPTQRAIANFLSDIPRDLGGLGWSGGKTLAQFFESPKGVMLAEKLGITPEGVPLVFRDLNADLLALHNKVSSVTPGYNADAFATSMFPGLEFKNSKVSDFMDISLPDTPNIPRPRAIVCESEWMHQAPDQLVNGYYPVLPRTGDPRPTVYSQVRALRTLFDTLPQHDRKLVAKWCRVNELTKGGRVRPSLQLDLGIQRRLGPPREVKSSEIDEKPDSPLSPPRMRRR